MTDLKEALDWLINCVECEVNVPRTTTVFQLRLAQAKEALEKAGSVDPAQTPLNRDYERGYAGGWYDMMAKAADIAADMGRADVEAKIRAVERHPRSPARSSAGTAQPPQPIETAPKDGSHILAWRIPIGIRVTNNTHPPTVVHWFDDPDEPGFYTSVNELAPQHPFNPTHWAHLPEGPR